MENYAFLGHVLQFPDSLKTRTSIYVVAALWYNVPEARISISRDNTDLIEQTIQKCSQTVAERIFSLPECTPERHCLIDLVPIIGEQLLLFWANHPQLCSDNILIEDIYWNSDCTIDRLRTLSNIIDKKRLSTISLFECSCYFYMEDKVNYLWQKILQEGGLVSQTTTLPGLPLEVCYWVCLLQDKLPDLQVFGISQNVDEDMFSYSVGDGNIYAVKYFFPRLYRNRSFTVENLKSLKLLRSCYHSETLGFFLSQLSSEQQCALFLPNTLPAEHYTNLCFIFQFMEWPRVLQLPHLMHTCCRDLGKTIKGNFMYTVFFEKFSKKIDVMHLSHTYRDIFRKSWLSLNPKFHAYVVQKCVQGSLLERFFERDHINDLIELIMSSCTEEQKEERIFTDGGFDLLRGLCNKFRWGHVNFYMSLLCRPELRARHTELFKKYLKTYKYRNTPNNGVDEYFKRIHEEL